MELLNNLYNYWQKIQRVLKIKDSITVSIFSGFLGTLVIDIFDLFLWKRRKTEILIGHLAGSIFMLPLRVNRRKNFWLGQITHFITGTILAYPLNYIFQKTGKDNHLLKGAMYGAVLWEFVYGIARRFEVFGIKPHLVKTHYMELFVNILYGLVTAQALVTFSEPGMFPDNQNQAKVHDKSTTQPLYSDINNHTENILLM